jgi:(2Fe-2S) ferredoxin
MNDKKIVTLAADKKNIGKYSRHFLFCTGPKCIEESEGLRIWAYLKDAINTHGIGVEVYRSKVGCLRICAQGPIAVVYPEGTWYRLVDEKAIDEIIESHIKNGIEVEDYKFASNPLS